MEVFFSVKIFEVEFLSDLQVLSPKKWFLEIGLCLCMYYASKLIKIKKKKNHMKYQIGVQIKFSDFDKNRKSGSGVDQTGNETRSENLKNIYNDFLQT